MSDLHLSFSCDKPMDIFRGWENHTDRLAANWNRVVTDDDTVVLPGDFSWGLKIEETLKDFEFLSKLNGKKIILKGNHDLWWGTKKKILEFFEKNDINNIEILFNNAFLVDGVSVCGSRGWFIDSPESDKKILLREAARLETSIKAGIELGGEPIVFIHYPPVYGDFVCREIFDIIKKYDIKKVYHGHIHGAGLNKSVSHFEGVDFKLVSCDCVDFTPVFVKK
ncbi:MAG: serine/threonine protein phosphatase [Ruminococcaceae bacterium]|nr:serine/threonine protein phosphatase [Oscillospiraceae bacterium]